MAGNKNSGRKANEKPIAQNLAIILDEVDPSSERKKMLTILHKLVDNAIEGDLSSMREIFDRLEGKVPQGIVGGGSNGELEVVFKTVYE